MNSSRRHRSRFSLAWRWNVDLPLSRNDSLKWTEMRCYRASRDFWRIHQLKSTVWITSCKGRERRNRSAIFRGNCGYVNAVWITEERPTDAWFRESARARPRGSFERASGMKEREMKLFGCRWSFWNFATNLAGS